ncbi:hypothetical protein OGAPHI_000270 [Ogataea philodendri]|uniref:Uncharacterized protein n=2 Tax=Saccharomycotina TaxID=147537 RepID=A0A9P8PGD6_9ASCO|nr:uncharacterized protein OGAPHI_000270 [Ogataea philodendri]KAH3671567.1 hypothetical protein OGAPHI_000270 [Ogataea philodendri]
MSVKLLFGTNSGTSEVSTHKKPHRFLTILSEALVFPTLLSSTISDETVDAARSCNKEDSSALMLSIRDLITGVSFFGRPASFKVAAE